MSLTAKQRTKKCKCGCQQTFTPRNSLQIAATVDCAMKLARKQRESAERQVAKVARKADREAKENLKTRRDWINDAQYWVNKWVKERDFGLPCISCGRHHNGQIHAGHYLSRGAHPELALEPKNIHLQCQPCNVHLSGNQINYRKGLLSRYGSDLVDWLEGDHEPKHYTIDELKILAREYRIKFNDLVKRRSDG